MEMEQDYHGGLAELLDHIKEHNIIPEVSFVTPPTPDAFSLPEFRWWRFYAFPNVTLEICYVWDIKTVRVYLSIPPLIDCRFSLAEFSSDNLDEPLQCDSSLTGKDIYDLLMLYNPHEYICPVPSDDFCPECICLECICPECAKEMAELDYDGDDMTE